MMTLSNKYWTVEIFDNERVKMTQHVNNTAPAVSFFITEEELRGLAFLIGPLYEGVKQIGGV